jgi:hypothetical protein
MGQIGDFMTWFDSAVERATKNGGVLMRNRSSGNVNVSSCGRKVKSKRRFVWREIIALLEQKGDLPTEEVMRQMSCCKSSVSYARGKMRGAAWARPPKAVRSAMRARRQAVT